MGHTVEGEGSSNNKKAETKRGVSLETFKEIGSYELSNMKKDEPSCFNGNVCITKYRVRIELIDEPMEVYHQRLTKLWRECNNHHHSEPIRKSALALGLELNSADYGIDAK